MADQANSVSSTHTSDSKLDASKPTNKRTNTPAMASISKDLQLDHHTGPPPCKRPQRDKQPAKEEEDDMKDTATSNPKKIDEKQEDDESVDLPDLDVLQAIHRFQTRNGVYPFENSSAARDFLSPWIRFGFGKQKQWETKIEQVKNKFKKENGKGEEFELWMKIWGKKASGDDDDDGEGGCS